MKRSEMVENISIELQDIIQENYVDQKGFEWCAHLILLRLEELGMKPPTRLSDEGFTGHISSVYTNAWENEDEN